MPNEFLDDLFGDHEGIVYSPIKSHVWEQHFFSWPNERGKLEGHISDYSNRDVYLSPVLFNARRITPESFEGTQYLWTEFDGQLPSEYIEPSFRISSSIEGHEHWYWRLEEFQSDKVLVEDLTKRIAYEYKADLSVWDYQNVLRPPDTWNHKRNRPVSIVEKNNLVYSTEKFLWLPIPPAAAKIDINVEKLPVRAMILAKYKFTPDALDLLSKDEIATGKRSDALARFAHECVESGLSNEETYVLLEERDTAWGKFTGRTDRVKQLNGLVANARRKKLAKAEIYPEETTGVFRFLDFMNTNVQLKWVIEGILPVAGSMVIFGSPGVGKSTFSLRLIEAIALGQDNFLGWKIHERQRTLFVSLEMQDYEIKEFFKDMQIPEEQQQELQEWFHIWPVGHAYPLDTPDQQLEFLKYIDMFKIQTVVIDSHSLAMYGSIKDDDAVKRINSFLNEDVRKTRKCSYIFIHHPRKRGLDEDRKEHTQDDSFGSTYINANAQTVLVLSQKPGSSRLQVEVVKKRLMLKSSKFEIERMPNRSFQIVGQLSQLNSGQEGSDKKGTPLTIGKLANLSVSSDRH